jgi:hypothetical protein
MPCSPWRFPRGAVHVVMDNEALNGTNVQLARCTYRGHLGVWVSKRGLEFITSWAARNVDPAFSCVYSVKRARALAAACRFDASVLLIGLQEIEEEIGDLEEAILKMIEERSPHPWRLERKASGGTTSGA